MPEKIVIEPNSETPQETPPTIVQTSIAQAEEYGRMREAYQRLEIEAQATRLELESLRNRPSETETIAELRAELKQIQADQIRLLKALEEEEEEEEPAIQLPVSLDGTTTITPPIVEVVQQPEIPPVAKQSRLSRFLFGRDE